MQCVTSPHCVLQSMERVRFRFARYSGLLMLLEVSYPFNPYMERGSGRGILSCIPRGCGHCISHIRTEPNRQDCANCHCVRTSCPTPVSSSELVPMDLPVLLGYFLITTFTRSRTLLRRRIDKIHPSTRDVMSCMVPGLNQTHLAAAPSISPDQRTLDAHFFSAQLARCVKSVTIASCGHLHR